MQTMAPPARPPRKRTSQVDERFARVDERFDEVSRRITEGREETNRRFDQFEGEANRRFDRVEGDIKELKESVAAVHASVLSLHTTLMRVGVGLAIVFASALLVRGF